MCQRQGCLRVISCCQELKYDWGRWKATSCKFVCIPVKQEEKDNTVVYQLLSLLTADRCHCQKLQSSNWI